LFRQRRGNVAKKPKYATKIFKFFAPAKPAAAAAGTNGNGNPSFHRQVADGSRSHTKTADRLVNGELSLAIISLSRLIAFPF
jgi:hypothetical protein